MPANNELADYMASHLLTIRYAVLNTSELDAPQRELCHAATEATSLSYSPYSNFKVGASARLSGGTVIRAANLENAAYPQCMCAEATLLGSAHTQYAGQAIISMAIAVSDAKARSGVAAPCGSCRQQLYEWEQRQGQPIELYLVSADEVVYRFDDIKSLLPFGFTL